MHTETIAVDAAALSSCCQALADEKRVRILEILGSGERCVCDLAAELDVSQPLLSFHLRTLREAGLVSDRKEGRWVHYSGDPEALSELAEALQAMAMSVREAAGRPGTCC
jgi:ArsR family transcriptional regulator